MFNSSKNRNNKISKSSIANAKGILTYLKPYKWTFILGWFFLILSSSVGLFFPYLLGQLLGGSQSGTSTGTNYENISLINLDNINTVALLLLILFVTQSVFSFFRIILFTNVTENTLRDIRLGAMKRLIYMPLDFFNKNKVGELTSRLSADITLIQDTLKTTLAEFLRQIIVISGSIIFITIISWRLSLIMLAIVPVMAIIAVLFGRFIRKLGKEAQNAAAESNNTIEEALSGISNVKSYTNEGFVLSKYLSAVQTIRKLNIRSGNWRGLFVSFIILCLFGGIIFIIWQGLHMTIGENPILNKGDFFSFVMFTVFMGASIGAIPDLYASIQKAIGSTEKLMELISEKNESELFTGTKEPEISGEIRFEDVSFSYPMRKDLTVLKELSFHIESGKQIAIVGASGAGKSTIVSLLLRFYDIEKGNILIDGNQLNEIEINHLRSHIAVVPQEVLLFGGTIRENILFGKPDATSQEIEDAAKKANAFEFIQSFTDGFDTQVGDRGIQLSGGQKQRIAIARAILKNPKILILDEATSALDAESEKLVQEALNELLKNRTAIVIAHRLSTIRKADNIIVLEHGKIVESGNHNELLSIKNGVYTKLSELQFQIQN